MDSNKIQNEQTNTFSGGMNTDAADHVLSNDQYRDALNLRYVNNKESAAGSKHINGSAGAAHHQCNRCKNNKDGKCGHQTPDPI